jgi:hypothetical protein
MGTPPPRHHTACPRLTKMAGFELGSGLFINVSLTEENACFVRESKWSRAGPLEKLSINL